MLTAWILSRLGELPALQNGSVWVSRFRNIVDYLRQYSSGDWDLDGDLDESIRADNIAFSSFVESRGQPLLDLSLYVTSQNYYGNTSPAYGSLLQWPNQWILPPKLHAAAKARTEYLGLSSLDLQAMEEQRQRDHSAAVASGQVPKNLIQRPADTVSSLLGRTAQRNHFRLDALTGEFFEPLEAMLGKKQSLLAGETQDSLSSLDCIALGYLSLALVPDLTSPWLRDAMRAKAPQLTAYTEHMRRRCFGEIPVEVAHAYSPQSTTLLTTLADNTPFLSEVRRNRRLKQAAHSADSGLEELETEAVSTYAEKKNRDMYLSIATVVAGATALVGYVVHIGLLSISVRQAEEEEEEEEDGEVELPDLSSGNATDFLNNVSFKV
ncbi:hypothetical protein N7512_009837 [Penicillium capsulatum]|nr:hypothetical protein N7512_009837 [Penicillium capsulatum]